ncbi:Helix-turn-helix domain-containing protein [Caloranaerobacter azorensis DSM 13643]|uniref:Helix-turn-helix domain-containing protein n=1 Tax=Caloranaerobacter azorensis DSM 13643 TaxID=1121264 RepID=A0A1M5TTD8_9FIRM|nr:helix-turn-helix transcriptional regulator [Caloranaerobacter azorensis]SHH54042.1 Helix-turn-helix domain-containing protein [Caloranaerobacter azorensis DSM 13643]
MATATFGERFKQLRKEKNMTQEELAKKFFLNKSSISRYEQNKQVPEMDLLKGFADFFNVSIDYLLGRTDIRNPEKELTPEEKYPEVTDVEEAMKIILEQPGLMLNGELLTDEDKIILANAIQMGLRTAEEMRKKRKESKKTD